MSHWFDRLASWSADDTEAAEAQLTRRQAVKVAGAAAGVGAAGLFGGPLANKALGIAGGNSPQCKCWDKAGRINDNANYLLFKNIGAGAFTPVGGAILIFGLVGTHAAYLGQVVNCGLCKDDPPLEPPPPKFQPCTQRGGVRLRGEQCGGSPGAGAEVGGCAGGTSSCPTPGGGDLCCFGSDRCCSGCCCIAEVGCGCCG
jgi:hypothetical protein